MAQFAPIAVEAAIFVAEMVAVAYAGEKVYDFITNLEKKRTRARVLKAMVKYCRILAFQNNRLKRAFESGVPVNIPYSHLKIWTDNFDPTNVVGIGGFGTVFKGFAKGLVGYRKPFFITPISSSTAAAANLAGVGGGNSSSIEESNTLRAGGGGASGLDSSDIPVAIKRVNPEVLVGTALASSSSNIRDAKKAIQTEINVLSAFRDCPNIIRLVGYCINGKSAKHLCLVYEVAPRGDLLHFLTTKPPWQTRLQIALGIAKGLNFLHTYQEEPIYHRDIKSGNIVLMQDFTPKIIDCGLATYVPDFAEGGRGSRAGSSSTRLRYGTPEYMCSEYCRDSLMRYDELCEIYSFGTVLLELLTGMESGKTVEGRRFFFKSSKVKDLKLDVQWPSSCEKEYKSLAEVCISEREDRVHRVPNMHAVVRELEMIHYRHHREQIMSTILNTRHQAILFQPSIRKGKIEEYFVASNLTPHDIAAIVSMMESDLEPFNIRFNI